MTVGAVERSQVRFGTRTIAYTIRRSSRRATVSIAIDPAEGVLVTAPEPAPIGRLDDIVHAKASWIVQRLKRLSDLPPPWRRSSSRARPSAISVGSTDSASTGAPSLAPFDWTTAGCAFRFPRISETSIDRAT
jgi:hypothetical protein